MSKFRMLVFAFFAVAVTAVNAQNLFVNTTKIGGGPIGYMVYNNTGSYTVYGGGNDIWDTVDEFTFHYYQVTGDFDVRVRVDYVQPIAKWTKAGIMVRETTDNNCRMAFIKVTPSANIEGGADGCGNPTGNGDVSFNYRKGYSGADGQHEENMASYPTYNWVRLERVGNIIRGYTSQDGITWSTPKVQDTSTWANNTPFANTALLGFAVSRHGCAPFPKAANARTEFRNFGDANKQPVIIEQPKSQSVTVGSTATFTVDNAAGYDFVTYQWMKNGVDIAGATSRTYTTPAVTIDDNGSRYSVKITNTKNSTVTTSSEAVLSVGAFVLSGATANENPNAIVLNFSKPVTETTALNAQNYTVQGLSVTAAAFGQDAKQVVLTVTPSMTYQSQYQVTVKDLQESESSATISPNPSTITVTFAQGYTLGPRIIRNYYTGTGGSRISYLLSNSKFPYSPDVVDYPPYFEDERGNYADYVGGKIYGWFVPPVSGNYKFYTAGDDENIVYMSTDENPLNKRQIATQSDWGNFRDYFDDTSTASGNISLVAGNKYYLEVLWADGTGGGHCSVAVQYPGGPTVASGSLPIPASMFAPMYYVAPNGQTFTNFGPVTISKQPSSQTIKEGNAVTFKVGVDGSAPYTVTWYTNNVVIDGVTGTEFTIPYVDFTMDGTVVKAKVQNSFSSTESMSVVLNVIYDNQPPKPIYAVGDMSFTNIIVKFDEPITEDSAVDGFNYNIASVVDGTPLDIEEITVVDPSTVRIKTPPQTQGVQYEITISGIIDRAPAHNILEQEVAVRFTAWMMSRGFIKFETYNTGGTSDTAVETTENYINAGNPPREVFYIPTFNSRAAYPGDEHDGYGGRLVGYLIPPVTGEYMIYSHADDGHKVYFNPNGPDPAGKVQITYMSPGCCAAYGADAGSVYGPVTLQAGVPYYIEGIYKEGGGGDYMAVAAKLASDPTDPASLPDIPAKYLGFLANPDAAGDIVVATAPQSISTTINQFATFIVDATSSLGYSIFYQWQKSTDGGNTWVDIVDANTKKLVVGPLTIDDNGTLFRVQMHIPGKIVTLQASLTVTEDNVPPDLVKAFGGGTNIVLVFSELMDTNSVTDPWNYQIQDQNGNYLEVKGGIYQGTQVTLITDPQIAGNHYTVLIDKEIAEMFDLAGNMLNNNVVEFDSWLDFNMGQIKRMFFNGLSGNNDFTMLTNSPNFPYNPTAVDYFDQMAVNPALGDSGTNNYGARLLGFIIPPETGLYRFQTYADDSAWLKLNTNSANSTDPSGMVNVVYSPGYVGYVTSAQSYRLEAGKLYAVEALMQEGGGGDYLVVRWALPSDSSTFVTIRGTNLASGLDPVVVTLQVAQQPQNVTISQTRKATFNVEIAKNPSDTIVTYQWQVSNNGGADWQDIQGATAKSYTTPDVTLADDGKQFRCVVKMTGIAPMVREATSNPALLTVIADEVLPTAISMNAFSNFIGIEFSERVDAATATNIANYSINGGGVQITNIEFRTNETQVKILLGQNISGQVTVNVAGVKDLVGNQMQPSQLSGVVSDLMFIDIGNPLPAGYLFTSRDGEFDVMAGGYDVWSGVNQFSYIYKPITGDFDVKVRVQRLDNVGNNWSKAGINVRELLNEQSGMFWAYPTPATGAGTYEGGLRQNAYSGIIDFGQPRPRVAFPNSWVRIKREGQIFTAYTSTNGYNWNLFGTPQEMPSMPQTMFVGLATVSHIQGTPTYAEFRDYGFTVYSNAVITITQQPVIQNVSQGAVATFVVNAQVENAPAAELTYKWQINSGSGFVDIPNTKGNTLTVVGSMANNGCQYRAIVSVPGVSVESQPALLSVNVDTIPPVAVSAIRSLTRASVKITFSEPMDSATATDVNNYAISGGVQINSITLLGDGTSVNLSTTPIMDGSDYLITINNVKDVAGNPILPNTQVSLIMLGNRMPVGSPAMVVVEAESYDRNANSSSASWQFQSSQSGYSGTGYMTALPNSGTTIGDNDFNSPRLDYDIDFPAAGNWYIWVRATSTGDGDNSAHIGLDGIRTAKTTQAGDASIWSTSGSWGWENRRANGGDQMVVYVPNEGVHTLSIWMREDGLMVDKILLFSQASDPEGLTRGSTAIGPDETPLPTGYGVLHIVQQPQTITVNPGQTAQFTVVAQSSAKITYQWKKDGANILNATNATLVIENVQSANAGAYTVVVSDGVNADVTSAIAYLMIGQPPVIVQQPHSQSVLTGTNVNLTVVATGAGLTYQWYKGQDAIPGAIGSILTFRNVSPSDAGVYTVKIQGALGTVTSEAATITVNTAPYIITPLVSKSVNVGGNVTFSVQAGGDPVLTYVWKKNGVVITGAAQSQLVLTGVQKSDEGQYTVEVTNPYGTASSTAQLFVNTAPIASDVTVQTSEDVPVAIQLATSDSDNNPIAGVNIVTAPTHGTVNYLTNYIWSSDFNSTEIQGAKLYGVATILSNGGIDNSGVLRLTPNANGQVGSIVFNEFAPGATIKGFTATFKAHLGEGSGNPADGFSFNFANDLVDGESVPDANENGAGSGLRVCFKIYNDDIIVIKKGQTELVNVKTPVYGFVGYVDCSITFKQDGTVTMLWNGQTIAENLQTGIVPGPGYRFGMYARTGGENANMMFDNLTINAQLDRAKIFYTPAENFNGQDQFTYTVTDGMLESAPATVTVNVLPVNDAPIAVDVSAGGNQDTAIDVQMQVVDVDNTGETMTYIVPEPPQNGTLTGGTVQDTVQVNYSANFNAGNTVPGAVLYGVAEVLPNGGVDNTGVLKLTRNANSQRGSIVINDFAPGTTVKKFTATFKMHLGEGTDNPADGFSFNFANDLVDGAMDGVENGVGSGLRVCFKIYNDDTIQIRHGEQTLVDFPTQVYGLSGYVECTVNFDEDGTVDVVWNGIQIATDLQTGVVPGPGYRFGIYARTGGQNANQWLDDLQINATLYKSGMIVTTNPKLTYIPNAGWFGMDAFNYVVFDGALFSAPATANISVIPTGGVIPPKNHIAIQLVQGGTGFNLLFNGDAGKTYKLLRATEIEGPWTVVDTQIAPANGLLYFGDNNPPPADRAFYRVVSE